MVRCLKQEPDGVATEDLSIDSDISGPLDAKQDNTVAPATAAPAAHHRSDVILRVPRQSLLQPRDWCPLARRVVDLRQVRTPIATYRHVRQVEA